MVTPCRNCTRHSLRIVESKRREVLGWLSKVDVGAHHEVASGLRFDDTGGWLFEKPAFQSWVEADCASVMWLHGKGKRFHTLDHDNKS